MTLLLSLEYLLWPDTEWRETTKHGYLLSDNHTKQLTSLNIGASYLVWSLDKVTCFTKLHLISGRLQPRVVRLWVSNGILVALEG